jgi:hypothetical protein
MRVVGVYLSKTALTVVASFAFPKIGVAEQATPGVPLLAQDAYIWQRIWSPPFRQGILDNGHAFAALDVLVAELSLNGASPITTYAKPDWPALLATGRPIGLVIRSRSEPLVSGEAGSRAAKALGEICVKALSDARGAGVEPVELQLDLDAATSQLPAYRSLLHRLHEVIHPIPLALTVLPDWLRSAEFASLVGEAESYVLQVHSLERPTNIDQPFSLCDPVRAERWVREASALGIPFRVALPTYGYRVAFGPDGKFIGLQAEGPERAWPVGSMHRTILSDPGAMALLVRSLLAAPPKACKGIVWFRMPSEDDRLAWHWATLRKVMAGELPEGRLVFGARTTQGSLVDLTLSNEGSMQISAAPVRVTWQGARLVAADGIAGWRLEQGGGVLILHPPLAELVLLFPGEKLQIGWMRLDSPVPVEGVMLP